MLNKDSINFITQIIELRLRQCLILKDHHPHKCKEDLNSNLCLRDMVKRSQSIIKDRLRVILCLNKVSTLRARILEQDPSAHRTKWFIQLI
jgi:hypothetical protein